jgi:Response regulator containing CheY-like receiver domain and AraC-type DNA-binding domain
MIKMFVCDDEQIVVDGIKDSINWDEQCIEVCGTANNGSDALKKSMNLMPDIIVSDIRMPGLSGLEFVKEFKSKLPKSQIILISAYQEFEYAKEAIKLGVLSYITKPFKKNQILEEVLKARDVVLEDQRKMELNSKFEKELPTLRNYFLNSIILGDELQLEDYEEKVQQYRLNLSKRNTGVFVICPEIPNVERGSKSVSLQRLLTLIEKSILKLPKELRAVAFINHVNDVVIIYGSELIGPYGMRDFEKCLEMIKSDISQELGVTISIGVGRTYFDYNNIYLSFKEAMNALNYKLIYGEGSIIFIDNVASAGSGIIKVVVCINKKIERFENLLSIGNSEESLKMGREIEEILRGSSAVSYGYVQQVFAQLLSSIIKKSIEFNIYNDILSQEITDLYEKIYAMKSLSELSDFFSEIIKRICAVTEKKSREINSGTIKRALEFMQMHCHENISQTAVAEYVGLNPSYFSRYFKEEIGQSFMDYMKRLRIEKAKELLSSTSMKIYEISEALGYQSVQYFTTLFKTMVGLTPQEYKDKKQMI